MLQDGVHFGSHSEMVVCVLVCRVLKQCLAELVVLVRLGWFGCVVWLGYVGCSWLGWPGWLCWFCAWVGSIPRFEIEPTLSWLVFEGCSIDWAG